MDESEIIRQLREQNELLRLENEMLKARIRELEARLAQYENAHTPPSLRRGRNRKKDVTIQPPIRTSIFPPILHES